jgi:predicted PurR-regulated permease PerM
MLASVGSPLMKLLQKLLNNKRYATSLSAGITLFLMVSLFSLGIYFLIPFIIKEIDIVSSIDPMLYTSVIENWLQKADIFLYENGFLSKNEHVGEILSLQMKSFISTISLSKVIGNLFSFAGTLLILIFSVIFLSYYVLKDKEFFFKMIKRAIPTSYRDYYDRILSQTRTQLVRYFSGVLIDNVIVGIAIGMACYFANIPNALLIGFLSGVFNIIPYIGPFIAMGLALAISITSLLPTEPTAETLSMLFWKMAIIFVVIKAIDTFFLSPFIFGKSIRVHPVEIFIVILLAGYIGGIVGMIFAVPAYSMIRIIIKEFFGSYFGNYYPKTLSNSSEIE